MDKKTPETDQPARQESGGEESPRLELSGSRQFASWLNEVGASLAFTTYQAGKLFFIGCQADGRLSIFERSLPRCMGMFAQGGSLWVTSLFQLFRFENALEPGQDHDGYDRLYLPQMAYITGDLDIHDLALNGEGSLIFVNTLFSCLATTSETHSFVPVWKPPFVTRLAAEDRCHLNGLAMADGQARYVTAVAETDLADGWRDHRGDGGVIIHVETGEIVARGLSMPHAPRVYRDKLWLHNSGAGYFGTVEPKDGTFQPVAFCPGYLRGLAFIGNYAVVGLSKSRKNKSFSGLELDENLSKHKVEPRCAIYVIDLRTGDVAHWLRIEGVVEELYDVVVLPGVRRPMAIGFLSDEIRRVVTIGDSGGFGNRQAN